MSTKTLSGHSILKNINRAPVALFVYNRPEHTRRTVEMLATNLGATDTDLYIYSDASKSNADLIAVNEVRKYIRQINGFRQLIIVERAENFGLAQSIIQGVTELCNLYGRVIVLEDDLETSPYFLTFMNEALDYYVNTPEVMHISGCRYPIDSFGSEDTFFLHVPLCWGWATWKRAWDTFEKDISVMRCFDRKMVKHFNFENTYTFWKQIELNKAGKINTWFVFWYANIFLRGGLSLFPARSLVNNIGMDKSGTHRGNCKDYDVKLTATKINVTSISLSESVEGYELHLRYFKKIKMGLMKRVVRKVRHILKLEK
jgi:hypothetical protein